MFDNIVSHQRDGITFAELRVTDGSNATLVYDFIFNDDIDVFWCSVIAVKGNHCTSNNSRIPKGE